MERCATIWGDGLLFASFRSLPMPLLAHVGSGAGRLAGDGPDGSDDLLFLSLSRSVLSGSLVYFLMQKSGPSAR